MIRYRNASTATPALVRDLTDSEIGNVAGGCPILVAIAVAVAIMAIARTAE